MQEYQNLIKMLKIYYHNISILHRHVVGKEWFPTHEKLNEYYDHIADDIDELCEVGMSIEIDEPTIRQSLDSIEELEIRNRDSEESFETVKGYFNDIIAQINRINGVPADVINLLQEKQLYYRKEANYKLFRTSLEEIEK